MRLHLFRIFFGIVIAIYHAGSPLKAQELIYGEVGDLTSRNPLTASDPPSLRLIELIFDGLVGVDKHGGVKMELAKDVEIFNGGLTYVFHLHDDIQWHDGHPFTAYDVEFTFDLLTRTSPHRARFDFIDQVRAIDSNTVVVTLRYSVDSPLKRLDFKILPKHILERGERFGGSRIGTGAFKFVGWRDDTIRLTANRNKTHNPKIDTIYCRFFNDADVAVQALAVREIDLLPEFPVDCLPLIRGDLRRQYSSPALAACIGYNLRRPYLQDVRVRQAFTYALNRAGLLNHLYSGEGSLSSGPFPPDSILNNPNVKPFPLDLQKAKALLAAAKAEGKFTDKSHVFKAIAPSKGEIQTRGFIFQAYSDALRAIGVEVKYDPVERGAWKRAVFEDHDFDITYIEYDLRDLTDITPLFHSSATGPGQGNIVGYINPQVDNLIADLNNVKTPDGMIAIYHQLYQVIANDCPYTFLWWVDSSIGYNVRLRNVSCHDAITLFENIDEWEIEKTDEH